jgi:hypothetical protein
LSNVTVKERAYNIPLSINMYREANEKGVTLSQHLESIDPTEEYGAGEKLDAFERQLKRFGIITQAIPESGIHADKVEKFYVAADGTKGDVIFPEYVNRIARRALIADDVLSEIVGVNTPIDSNAYRSIYVNYDPKKAGKRRVSQGADMPVAEMTISENTINLFKYGRRIKATYEAVRRMRIDQLALHIEYIMKQAALDRAQDAYDVLVGGDGNGNAAANDNLTALDAATSSGIMTYAAWTSFLFNFYPYQMTTLIGGKNELVKFLTMNAPNIDPLRLIEQLRFGQASTQGTMAQSIFNNYRIVYLPNATANKLVGFDKRYSVEMVSEIGSDITETQKLISSQWNEIVISEVNGFGIFQKDPRRVLTLNA